MGIDEQRREAVERLKALTLEGGSHEMLSAIARAVMPDAGAWTVGACRGLRDRLVALIGRGGEWARGYDEGFASADDWLAEHEDEMAQHGWVRKDKEHVISHATVEVTPRIDWMRMADELDVFTQLVRGFAEQVGEDE